MVFTNDKCIGCNKCIRECPNLLANKAADDRIDVDDEMCIKCGACFDACNHGAMEQQDVKNQHMNHVVNEFMELGDEIEQLAAANDMSAQEATGVEQSAVELLEVCKFNY